MAKSYFCEGCKSLVERTEIRKKKVRGALKDKNEKVYFCGMYRKDINPAEIVRCEGFKNKLPKALMEWK